MLEEALSRGADFSEVFYEDTESNVVTLTDLAVEDAVFSRKCGVGIRVARGVLTAYATTADLSEQALLSAARAAAAALDALHWQEIVGCIAGDDTIFCAVRSVDDTMIVMEKLKKAIRG